MTAASERDPAFDEAPGCFHKIPGFTVSGTPCVFDCELRLGHKGPHRALIGDIAEISLPNEKQILREQEQHEAKVVAEHDVLTVTGGATVAEIAAIVNDLEAKGDELDVHFLRDEHGVQGLVITGRVSRETMGGMR